MRMTRRAVAFACVASALVIRHAGAGDLKPYSLTAETRARFAGFAAGSDVLVLGELHGTQEVPRLVAGLLAPLNERGYRVLALEMPHDQQESLQNWALGRSARVPAFFTDPSGDGRGNAQLLELVRLAVAPPYRWKLVCFDEPEITFGELLKAALRKRPPAGGKADELTDDEALAVWRKRDATMAANLLAEVKSVEGSGRVLAVCGNLHARTADDGKEPMLTRLWPPFAATVKAQRPAWRVRSVNIDFSRGAFFNEGQARPIRSPRPIEEPVVRPGEGSSWDLLLDLPEATPATFLPRNAAAPK